MPSLNWVGKEAAINHDKEVLYGTKWVNETVIL